MARRMVTGSVVTRSRGCIGVPGPELMGLIVWGRRGCRDKKDKNRRECGVKRNTVGAGEFVQKAIGSRKKSLAVSMACSGVQWVLLVEPRWNRVVGLHYNTK